MLSVWSRSSLKFCRLVKSLTFWVYNLIFVWYSFFTEWTELTPLTFLPMTFLPMVFLPLWLWHFYLWQFYLWHFYLWQFYLWHFYLWQFYLWHFYLHSPAIFIKFEIVVCKLFQFGRVQNLLFGKGLKNWSHLFWKRTFNDSRNFFKKDKIRSVKFVRL